MLLSMAPAVSARHSSMIPFSPASAPTLRQAQAIARFIRRICPGIDAICVYGSVARGDATEWSDIDFLVLGSDPRITPERLIKALSRRRAHRVSLIYYPTSVFRELYKSRALFIAHVRQEGRLLYDRAGVLANVFAQPFVPNVDVAEGVRTHLARLRPYDDTTRFGGNFLFCLSHLYSIAKGIIMLGLASKGLFEFNREAAFQAFQRLHPDLEQEIARVFALRPFYNLVTGRRPEPLPYPYHDADRQTREVVADIRTLAKRAIVS
jgi:predicted nucleotidyltransferase